MHEPDPPPDDQEPETGRLAYMDEELRTALTSLQTNVDLAVRELDHAPSGERVRVIAHLAQADQALARLRELARVLRGWRAPGR